MRLLFDTHTFLWFVLGDGRLSIKAKTVIEDPTNEKFLSPASYWEIAIKISLGKYTLSGPYEEFMVKGIGGNGFFILPIEPKHTAVLTTLPLHHRDPFDRLIIRRLWLKTPLSSVTTLPSIRILSLGCGNTLTTR